MIEGFTEEDHYLVILLAPRGTLIKQAGVPSSVHLELPNTIDVEFFPSGDLTLITPKGVQHVANGLRRLVKWRAFLDMRRQLQTSSELSLSHILGMEAYSFLPHTHPMLPSCRRRQLESQLGVSRVPLPSAAII